MQLKYSEAGNGRKLNMIQECLVGILLAAAFMAALCSALGISLSPADLPAGNPADGFISLWNTAADRFGENNFLILPKYAAEHVGTGPAVALIGVMLILFSICVVRSHLRPLLLFYLVPFVFMLALGLDMRPWTGILFAAAVLLSFTVMGSCSGTGLPILREAAVSVLILAAVMTVWIHAAGITEPQLLTDAGAGIVSRLEDVRYGSGILKNGELNGLDNRRAGDRTALKITMEKPQSMYLRGYVGEIYTGSRWNRLSNQTAYSFRDTGYGLQKRGFSALTQAACVQKLIGQKQGGNTIRIRTESADRRNSYLPYELMDGNIDGMVNFADAAEKPTGFRGASDYSVKITDNQTGVWTDQVGRLFSGVWNDARARYFVSESHYNAFVYENDTTVSTELRALLKKRTGIGAEGAKHMEYREAIEAVRKYLSGNFVYTEKIRPVSGGSDFLENFLSTRRGCDVHYATLAAMMFRCCGIPSRYVEGYLVTVGDEAEMTAGKAWLLPENRAHAWTEIYVDGYGWVPVETVPKYMKLMKQADLSIGLSGTDAREQAQSPQSSTGRDTEEPTKNRTRERRVLWIFGLAALCVLSALLLIWLAARFGRRLMREIRYRKAFLHRDPGMAVRSLYDYMKEKGFPLSEKAEALGCFAAFSNGLVQERDRRDMLEEMKRGKREKKQRS